MLLIGENLLTIQGLGDFIYATPGPIKAAMSKKAFDKVEKARAVVEKIVAQQKPVYSINTGFGALSDKFIPTHDLRQLQYNLIRSHCTGVGEPFSESLAKAIIVLRAHCLAQGHSGVQTYAIELLLNFLNHNVIPVIPQRGSVGASGDLAPLAHLALALIGEGEVFFQGKRQSSKQVMQQLKLLPLELKAKDGLALINGTAIMAALGALACYRAQALFKVADIAAALTLEATRGSRTAFDRRISNLKPHPGQLAVVENFELFFEGTSSIAESHINCGKVQDPYSLRCVPQVHGACRQTLTHCVHVTEIEMNSVADNPLVVSDDHIISGGNFHGEAMAMAMDYLSIGAAELCSISERRMEKMMNPHFSDLPPFLTKNAGLNSGLMIAHVTSAALVSENKVYGHPASIHSVPTSTDKEDHVSMGVTAGLKLHKILDNLQSCLAIEILASTQGMEFLRPLKSTPALEAVHRLVRTKVAPIEEDRVFHKDIEAISQLIASGEIVRTCEHITGPLK